MVVVHTLPRVQIHRLPSSFFDDDDELSFGDESKEHPSTSVKDSEDTDELESSDDGSSNSFDTDNLSVHMFGHLSKNVGENGHGIQRQNPHHSGEAQSKEDAKLYNYRTKLCYYLPRLFYITLVILVLYVIFWLFCAVPAAFYNRNSNRREAAGLAIIATSDGKRKKFHFTNNQKYFQLNNKRLSTTSLPPPYPGFDEAEEAEPFPAKQSCGFDNPHHDDDAVPVVNKQ
jgi:hypothetical protein